MENLIRGLHEFQSSYFCKHSELFERLAKNQAPEALFITCSDSRINPNLITQTQPGELFILRNAGNIVPPYGASNGGEGATIEYALAGLGVKDIIVCGHSDCGAMHGLLHPEKVRPMPTVAAWLQHAESTRRIVEENYDELQGEARLNATIEENVLVQLENLRTHPAVAARLNRGEVRLHGWIFEIETGEVLAYDVESGQFEPLKEVPAVPVHAPRSAFIRGQRSEQAQAADPSAAPLSH